MINGVINCDLCTIPSSIHLPASNRKRSIWLGFLKIALSISFPQNQSHQNSQTIDANKNCRVVSIILKFQKFRENLACHCQQSKHEMKLLGSQTEICSAENGHHYICIVNNETYLVEFSSVDATNLAHVMVLYLKAELSQVQDIDDTFLETGHFM